MYWGWPEAGSLAKLGPEVASGPVKSLIVRETEMSLVKWQEVLQPKTTTPKPTTT